MSNEVRLQVKFLEELDRLEKKRHEEAEREVLLRAAKVGTGIITWCIYEYYPIVCIFPI